MMKVQLFLLSLFIVFIGCSSPQNKSVEITVSIPPQKYFVQQLIGHDIPVNVMVTSGNNHASYEPTPQQLREVSDSKVYVKIGALGFENIWLPQILEFNKDIKVIDLSKSVHPIAGHEGCTGGDHDHEGVDPHIWTSPRTMKISVAELAKELKDIFPERADSIDLNLVKVNKMLDDYDHQLVQLSAKAIKRSIYIFHPALTYLARDYVFEQVAIEKDGKEPSAGYLVQLITMAKREGIKTVFIQEEFDKRNGDIIAQAIGGELYVINPMEENWPKQMELIINGLDKALN